MSSLKEKNNRILVVDDEVDVLEFLKIYLESLGWEVTIVSNTAEAFDELEKQPYFLVLTDIAMPEMDGYEFISRVKEKDIPSQMALMTGFGYNPKHTLVKIYKTIRYPCLFKPFNRSKVAGAVKNAWDLYHQDLEQSDSTK
ncbi:response regulator [Chitinispirillales bacterium ANBcel5]|uniref:response regulator n=1 Tax=Cellulosispirillum alkaliphilum TaxID=3039283 RepID=UPI002A51B888|nr:response regulator [Chitinispirillales bacterium ANBcel5]